MPKFNLNWLYMIIAMMLLGLYLTNESGSASKNIPYDEFQDVQSGPLHRCCSPIHKIAMQGPPQKNYSPRPNTGTKAVMLPWYHPVCSAARI